MKSKKFFAPTLYKIIAFVPIFIILYNVELVIAVILGLDHSRTGLPNIVGGGDTRPPALLDKFSSLIDIMLPFLSKIHSLTPAWFLSLVIVTVPAYLVACAIVYYFKGYYSEKPKPQKQEKKK